MFLYGKDIMDIHEDDWSAWLSASSYLTDRKNSIVLSNENPIVDSIIVYVDQVEIYDWSYKEKTNIVQLEHVPDYGQLVEVGYKIYME